MLFVHLSFLAFFSLHRYHFFSYNINIRLLFFFIRFIIYSFLFSPSLCSLPFLAILFLPAPLPCHLLRPYKLFIHSFSEFLVSSFCSPPFLAFPALATRLLYHLLTPYKFFFPFASFPTLPFASYPRSSLTLPSPPSSSSHTYAQDARNQYIATYQRIVICEGPSCRDRRGCQTFDARPLFVISCFVVFFVFCFLLSFNFSSALFLCVVYLYRFV